MESVGAHYVGAFRRLPIANVSDSMSRLVAGGERLRPMHDGGALAGPALTVKTCPGGTWCYTRRSTWRRRAS